MYRKILIAIVLIVSINTANAQIKKNIRNMVFNIECKHGKGKLVKDYYDLMDMKTVPVLVKNEEFGSNIQLVESASSPSANFKNPVKFANLSINGKMLDLIDGKLVVNKQTGYDRTFIYVEVAPDGEHVYFFTAKQDVKLNSKTNLLEYRFLSNKKYLTLSDSGKEVVLNSKKMGDRSLWKLYRVQ